MEANQNFSIEKIPKVIGFLNATIVRESFRRLSRSKNYRLRRKEFERSKVVTRKD